MKTAFLKKHWMTLMLGIMLAGVSAPEAHAQAVVGTCLKGAQYPTIQAAVNAAPSGAIIKVCPGGYQEQVVIEKPLTLEGITSAGAEGAWVLPPNSGWASTDPTSPNTPQILVKNTAGVTISNLIVDAANNNARCSGELTGVSFHNASGTVSKLAIRNQLTIESAIQCNGYGLLAFTDNQQPQTVVVQNSDFRNNGYWSLAGVGTGLTLNALNNFVTGGDNSQIGGAGIVYFSDATGTAQGNTVTNEIDVYGAPGAALSNSTAIAVECASATVTGNVITASQLGVYVGCNVSGHTGRASTVTQNKILYTKIADGIYVASAGNSITKNTVVASASSGIHLDTALGGINNTVSGNTITETCIGILTTGTGGSNTLSANTFNDVYIPTEKGTACAPIF
jgi:hypothetical protein